MNTISHADERDSTSNVRETVDYFTYASQPLHWNKLRVGIIKQFMDPKTVDKRIIDNFDKSIKAMEKEGVEVIELDFKSLDYCLPAYYIITAAECSSNLARYDGIRFGLEPQGDELLERYLDVRSRGFGNEVKRRILLGTYVLSAGYFDAYYNRAKAMRADLTREVNEMFSKVDVIACPTSPQLPFKFGEKMGDPVSMYMSDLCTVFLNLFGGCGISLPNGFVEEGGKQIPTALQFVCPSFRDSLLLRIASQFEAITEWKYEAPEWIKKELAK